MAVREPKEERELFYAYMRQNSLKKTYQKDLILETFVSAQGHLSVEDVYALVKKRDRHIGIVTVFRTLKSLTACGIAREISFGDGLTRFEHCYHHPHHHHIICTECQKTIEFISPELEAMQQTIVQRYHFQPLRHRFQIYGICEDCREHRPASNLHKYDTERVFARDALRLAMEMKTRCIEFYGNAADRNRHEGGREVFNLMCREEESHFSELRAQMEELQEREKDLDLAPVFLHFDPRELDDLMPNLDLYRKENGLCLDAREALVVALEMESRAAGYFRDFADKFNDTQGKDIIIRYAAAEMSHYRQISQRMEEQALASPA